jgi:hypothetical protein
MFGSIQGDGTLRFSSGGESLRIALDVEDTPSLGNNGKLSLVGPCTCEGGVVRGRLSATSLASGARVLGAGFEGFYHPQFVSTEFVAAWNADYFDQQGTRSALSGYLAAALPEDLRPDAHEHVATAR